MPDRVGASASSSGAPVGCGPCCGSNGRSTRQLAEDLEETLEVMRLGVNRIKLQVAESETTGAC